MVGREALLAHVFHDGLQLRAIRSQFPAGRVFLDGDRLFNKDGFAQVLIADNQIVVLRMNEPPENVHQTEQNTVSILAGVLRKTAVELIDVEAQRVVVQGARAHAHLRYLRIQRAVGVGILLLNIVDQNRDGHQQVPISQRQCREPEHHKSKREIVDARVVQELGRNSCQGDGVKTRRPRHL